MSAVLLADAKAHLNITITTYDTELQTFIDAAEAIIAKRVGPLASTPISARVSGGSVLLLPVIPALSLTSVTPVGGTALTVGDLSLDGTVGIVTMTGRGFASTSYDVVYQAGRSTLPADLRMAVLELVRHLWESQRSPTRHPASTMADAPTSAPGYLLPYRVQELIAPHEQMVGFS